MCGICAYQWKDCGHLTFAESKCKWYPLCENERKKTTLLDGHCISCIKGHTQPLGQPGRISNRMDALRDRSAEVKRQAVVGARVEAMTNEQLLARLDKQLKI